MSNYPVLITSSYQKKLTDIENFVWESTEKNRDLLEEFLTDHDKVLDFIKENPKTPAPHPQTGDQSWPFGNGRYRLFLNLKGKILFYWILLITE